MSKIRTNKVARKMEDAFGGGLAVASKFGRKVSSLKLIGWAWPSCARVCEVEIMNSNKEQMVVK